MSPYGLAFQEIDKTKIRLVGGKGSNLGELSRIERILVPDGFCISTIAFEKIIGQTPSINELSLIHHTRQRKSDGSGRKEQGATILKTG